MPKQTKGYLTPDGRFFETYAEAAYEEQKLYLTEVGVKSVRITQQNLPAFIDFIEQNAPLLIDYCKAYILLQSVVDEEAIMLKEMTEGEIVDAPSQKQTKTEKEDKIHSDRSRIRRTASRKDHSKVSNVPHKGKPKRV